MHGLFGLEIGGPKAIKMKEGLEKVVRDVIEKCSKIDWSGSESKDLNVVQRLLQVSSTKEVLFFAD